MAYLLDTNILLRIVDSRDLRRPAIIAAAGSLKLQGEDLWTTPQNYVEFWGTATRPISQNGFGLTPAAAQIRVRHLMSIFPVLSDTKSIFDEWLQIVSACSVSGRQVHDARLVAVMLAHGVGNILTFNVNAFVRYKSFGIAAVDPSRV